ncbi:MAG: hypothetical protein ACJ761_10060, partial [Chloroflexota bacterium]
MSALFPAGRDDVYWAGRATLISRYDLIADYDAAFEEWFRADGGPIRVVMEPVEGAAAAAVERDA